MKATWAEADPYTHQEARDSLDHTACDPYLVLIAREGQIKLSIASLELTSNEGNSACKRMN